ncbi:MAG: sulfotransferase [Gaiellaceae bacterium]
MSAAGQRVDASRLVVVAGIGRNGSSLLMRLLDGSPDLFVYPIELNHLSVVDGEQSFRAWAEAQQRELAETYRGWLEETVDPALDPVEPLSDGTATPEHDLLAYLDAFHRAYGADRTVERPLLGFKTIEGGESERYRRLLPGLRFVHIVRDPLTAYASLKRTDMLQKQWPFWAQGDLLRTFLERRFIPHVRFALEAARKDPSFHLVVTYERLVREPSNVVTEITDWLGIRAPEDPETQTVLGGRTVRELPPNTSKAGVATPLKVVPDLAGKLGYEDVVTSRERAFIAFRAAALAEPFGYDVAKDTRISRSALARQWLAPDRWELMNVRSWPRFGKALVERRAYILGKLVRT